MSQPVSVELRPLMQSSGRLREENQESSVQRPSSWRGRVVSSLSRYAPDLSRYTPQFKTAMGCSLGMLGFITILDGIKIEKNHRLEIINKEQDIDGNSVIAWGAFQSLTAFLAPWPMPPTISSGVNALLSAVSSCGLGALGLAPKIIKQIDMEKLSFATQVTIIASTQVGTTVLIAGITGVAFAVITEKVGDLCFQLQNRDARRNDL